MYVCVYRRCGFDLWLYLIEQETQRLLSEPGLSLSLSLSLWL